MVLAMAVGPCPVPRGVPQGWEHPSASEAAGGVRGCQSSASFHVASWPPPRARLLQLRLPGGGAHQCQASGCR